MMPFNHRYAPKEWAGIPRAACGGCLVALILLVLSLIAPPVLRWITVPLLCMTLAFIAWAVRLGDDWEFRSVMWRSSAEKDCVTSETWTVH